MQAQSTAVTALIEGNDVPVSASVKLQLPIWRTNLIPNPGFACHSASGYDVGPNTRQYVPVSDSSYPNPTQPVLHLESTGTSNDTYTSIGGDAGAVRLGMKPGATYTISAERIVESDFLVSDCNQYVAQIVVMLKEPGDAAYTVITSGDDSNPATINGSNYKIWTPDTRRSVTFTCPAATGECFIRLYLGVPNTSIGNPQSLGWTNVLLEESDTAGTYFDGSSADAEWIGQELYSPSRIPDNPYPDVTLAVESIQLDRTLTTDAPKGTRLISGYPTAQAIVTLAGLVDPSDETKTIAWLLDPANLDSPMARRQLENRAGMTIDLGTPHDGATDWVRVMTGTVDSFTYDRATGKVQLTVLDGRTKLRQVPNLPQITVNSYWSNLVTAEYAIDQLLLAASRGKIATRPPVRPQAFVAAGLRGSPQPDVGHLSDTTGGGGIFTPMPTFGGTGFGATDPTSTQWDNLYYDQLSIDSDDLYFELLREYVERDGITTGKIALTVDNNGTGSDSVSVWFEQNSITVDTYIGTVDTSSTFSTVDGIIGVHLNWPKGSTVMTVEVWDKNQYQTGTINMPSARNQVWTRATIGAMGSVAGASAQFTTEADPVANIGWIQRAFLDPSLNIVKVTPAISGDPFQAIQQICSAEQAVAGFDEYNIFRSKNRKTLAAMPLGRTISAKSSLRKFQTKRQAATQATRVTADYTSWAYSSPTSVFSLQFPLPPIDPGKSLVMTFTADTLVAQVPTGTAFSPNNNQSTNDGQNYVRWCNSKDGSVDNLNGQVETSCEQVSGNQIKVTITNTGKVKVWLVSSKRYTDVPAGTPFLVLGGLKITPSSATADSQWPPIEEGGAASGEDGEIALQLPSNAWRQDQTATQGMTDDVLADTYKPRELFAGIEINPDQRLQLADRVQWDAGLEQGTARLFGIHLRLSSTGMSQTVDGTADAWSGSWLMGVAGRSEMGVSTYV